MRDPGRADDVAQQTLLEAIQRPPADWSSPRGWLARAARNVACSFARADARRISREHAAARAELVTDAATLMERARLHRMLVDQVLALDEPYRNVLLMRFFEDLPAREIARRLDRPVETVRTQLARGLARIRGSLDAAYGDRRAWCLALAPTLLSKPKLIAGGSVVVVGGSVMSIKWIVPAVVVALLVWNLGYVLNALEASVPVARNPILSAVDVGDHEAVERERVVVEAAPGKAASMPTPMYEARLVDMQGRSMAGIAIVSRAVTPWVDDRGWIRTGLAQIDLEDERMREFFAAPDVLEELAERFTNPEEVLRAVRGERVAPELIVTDSEGRFAVRDPNEWPVRPKSTTMTVCRHLELPESLMIYGEARDPRVNFERIVVAGPAIRLAGRVLDANGVGITAAMVSVEYHLNRLPGYPQTLAEGLHSRSFLSAVTDARGRFELGRVPPIPTLSLVASHSAYGRESIGVPTTSREDLQITLDLGTSAALEESASDHVPARDNSGGGSLEIGGRLLDAEGNPIGGMNVSVLHGWPFNFTAADWPTEQGSTLSSLDGRFVIEDLDDHSYRVRAFDRHSLLVLESDLVPAGTRDLVMRASPDHFMKEYVGQVVDLHGLPVTDISVGAELEYGFSPKTLRIIVAPGLATTDARGIFTLKDFPRKHVQLRVGTGKKVKRKSVDVAMVGNTPQRIEVLRIYKIRFFPAAENTADHFEIQNRVGKVLVIFVERPNSTIGFGRAPLAKAEFAPVCVIDEEAVRVVLYKGDAIVGEVALDLRADVINDVRF